MLTIKPRVQGVTKELVELYQNVWTSTIGHMTDFGFPVGLKPFKRPIRFVGNAVTVRVPYLDSAVVHLVLDLVEPGDVILIDMSGDEKHACWGGGVNYAAQAKKIAGVIIDGVVTDYAELSEMDVPIYSLGISPITTHVIGKEGEINTPISIRGVTVNPGDLVLVDEDGIFIVNPSKAEEYGRIAIEKQAREPQLREKIDRGIALSEISGAIKFK